MKKIMFISLLIFLASSCNSLNSQSASVVPVSQPVPQPNSEYNRKLQIGNQTLMVEVSNTPAEMQQGLSNRVSMDSNQGMLFDFGDAATDPAFWMIDMNFNLDFIWISKNASTGLESVVGVTPNVPAPVGSQKSNTSQLPLYYPPSPVNWVVEINEGWAEQNGIKVGDKAALLN